MLEACGRTGRKGCRYLDGGRVRQRNYGQCFVSRAVLCNAFTRGEDATRELLTGCHAKLVAFLGVGRGCGVLWNCELGMTTGEMPWRPVALNGINMPLGVHLKKFADWPDEQQNPLDRTPWSSTMLGLLRIPDSRAFYVRRGIQAHFSMVLSGVRWESVGS